MIDNTFTLISRIDGEIRRFITEELAKEGITDIVPSHGAIIVELMKHGQLPMNELARHIDRTPQTVTSLVKKLVKSGYVETGKAPEDNRVTMAALTDPGARLAATLCRISEEIYELQYQGKFSIGVGSVSAHHQICDYFHIMILQHHNIGAIKTCRIFNFNKNTWSLVILYYRIPGSHGNYRCCNIDLTIDQ